MTRAQFVLVPGAGGDAWYWHRVVEELQARGHTAVAVHLPAADEACGLAEYVAAVLAAARGLSGGIVLVAQSLGGFTAAMAASRLDVRALALVNAMIPLPGETPGQWWEATGQPEAQNQARGVNDPADDFTHDLSPEVLSALEAHPHAQAGAVFASRCEFDSWPAVPIHALVGGNDRFFPPGFQRRICRDRLGIEATVVPGGHAIALSQPVTVAGWLERVATPGAPVAEDSDGATWSG